MRFWQLTLRQRLVIYFLLLALTPLVLSAIVVYRQSREILQNAVVNNLATAATLKENELNNWISDQTEFTRALAGLSTVVDSSEILLTSNNTDERASQTAYDTLIDFFESIVIETPDIFNISILTNVAGEEVLSTLKATEGSIHRTDPFFVRGRQETFVQNVYFSSTLNRDTITIATPLLNQQGETLGVLAIHLNLARLNAILLDRTGLGETGETYLVNQLDTFITPPREATSSEINMATIGIKHALDGLRGTSTYLNYQNKEVLGVYRWLENQELALLAEIELAEALAPASALVRTFLIVGLTLIVTVGIAIYILAGQISKPIATITKIATEVSAGNFQSRIPITNSDEIGQLSQAFNNMTEQLQTVLFDMEQQVAERTQALQTSANISRQLSTILNRDELIQQVVQQTRSAFDYYHVHIYLIDTATEELKMLAGTGEAGKMMLAKGHHLQKGQGLVGQAATTNQSILVADVSKSPNWLPNPLLPDTKAELAVPIAVGNEVLGVLDVQHNQVNGLSQVDVDLLESVANQVAVGLQNSEIYMRLQSQTERETQINSINQKIQSATTIEAVLQIATQELGQALAADRTSIEINLNQEPS